MSISNPSILKPTEQFIRPSKKHRLSEAHRNAIKNAEVIRGKKTIKDIAREYGVAPKTVRQIKNGENENRRESLARTTMGKTAYPRQNV